MKLASASEQAKLIISSVLGFALVMLVVAAFRVADPVVGERWQQFIELVIAVMGICLVILSMLYIQQFRRERQQLRRHYEEAGQPQPALPVKPASFALRHSPTQPS